MHVSCRINYACRLVLPYEFLFERQFSLRSRQAEAAGFRPRRPDAGVETGPREAALQLLPGRGGAGGETVKSFLRRSSFLFSKSRLSFCRLSLVLICEGYGRLLAVKEIQPEQAWHSVRTRQIQIASSPPPTAGLLTLCCDLSEQIMVHRGRTVADSVCSLSLHRVSRL